MSASALDHLISCQHALLAAFDARDADAIEQMTAALAQATEALQTSGAWDATDDNRNKLTLALKQAEAAKIRVNCLSDWTRQKIDQLSALRSGRPVLTYARWFKNHTNPNA